METIHKILDQFAYHANQPMIFNSAFFLCIFMGLLLAYPMFYKNVKARTIFFTIFSFYFYYKSSGIYFFLLIISIALDYNLAHWIDRSKSKSSRAWMMVLSLVSNLGILFYYKYTNFFLSLLGQTGAIHFNLETDKLDIFLPVGISFFTFQSLSYTIDVYRKNLKPINSILDYAFFVSFFPQLVAGPIVRASDFIPQIHKELKWTNADIGRAFFLIITGLFKKAVISDYISINFVDRVFDEPTLYTGVENLMAIYGYALQIYCDFSGYSDMAIGIALLLGFDFMKNFHAPYQSGSVTEFWRRWHISLSTWLRDYLYIPLGGNRLGKLRQYFNLLITMLLGGLWHGASLNFIFWGALHGGALALEKLFHSLVKVPKTNAFRLIGGILTFHFVCFCWIFFRCHNFKDAGDMLNQIFTAFHPEIFTQWVAGYTFVAVLILTGYIIHQVPFFIDQKISDRFSRSPYWIKSLALFVLIWFVIQIKSADIQPFIYFQF